MAKIALLSDVHGNYQALKAVIAQALQSGVEHFWFLGDAVNYGPETHRCLNLLKAHIDPAHWVLGNHDRAALLIYGTGEDILQQIQNRRSALSFLIPNEPAMLDSLAVTVEQMGFCAAASALLASRDEMVHDGDCLLVHGSFAKNHLTTYRRFPEDVREEFRAIHRHHKIPRPRLMIHGHTHLPTCFSLMSEDEETRVSEEPSDGTLIPLEADFYLINPGSVGQPRNGHPQASFAILDTGGIITADRPLKLGPSATLRYEKVPYPISQTKKRILALGLPPKYAERLTHGY